MLDISVIILTYNEEIHIKRCIENVQKFANQIFLVDSFSTDRTLIIAESLGVPVYQNKWENNHAKQFNWGLDNLPIRTNWILRLDADEYLCSDLIFELKEKLPFISYDTSGIVFPLTRIFLNREIKRTAGGPVKLLRLFRKGKAHCEQRLMDEHIEVFEGNTIEFNHPFVDHNLNCLSWWTEKHNGYSIREAIDLLDIELGLLKKDITGGKLSKHSSDKRTKKLLYTKQPLFLRAFAYFIYRYIFKLGFTEGKEGFLWHFLQGWWYRTLVDAKIFEIRNACGQDPQKVKQYILEHYKIKL